MSTARTAALAATSILALSAAALSAQEGATPPEPERILLAFKHKTGQVQRYKTTQKVDAAVSPDGIPNASPLPLTSKSVNSFTEKVLGTRQGTGTLSLSLNSLVTTTDILGMTQVSKLQGGKLTTTVNGQPVRGQDQAAQAAQLAALRKPAQVKRDPSGLTVAAGSPDNGFGQVFGSSSYTIVQFPAMPVKVGDTWETSQTIRPIAVSGRAPFVIPEINFRYTHTLKKVETRGGRKQALIETAGAGVAVGEGADSTLEQSVTGTTRFDIQKGAVVSSAYDIVLGMKLQLPPGASAGPDSLNAIRIDGTVDVVVMEAPTPKPAAKKKK